MAGIYSPIITNYPNGVVSVVSTTGTSYEQIINSMGSFFYEIGSMYIQSNTIDQVLQPLRFSHYDANGTLEAYNQVTTVDPFQYQSSINFDLSKDGIVLDGRTTLDTQMLANKELNVILYANEVSNKSLLSGSDVFSEDDFYKDYSKSVEETPVVADPKTALNDIKTSVSNGEDVKINLGDKLGASYIPKTRAIKDLPATIKPKIAIVKKDKNTYWILVAVASILIANYLVKKTEK